VFPGERAGPGRGVLRRAEAGSVHGSQGGEWVKPQVRGGVAYRFESGSGHFGCTPSDLR
jgi:hypothetical protein